MRAQKAVLFVARYNQALRNHETRFFFSFAKNLIAFLHCLERNSLVRSYTSYQYAQTIEALICSGQALSCEKEQYLLNIYPLYFSNYSLYSQLSLQSTKKQVFPISTIDVAVFRRTFKSYLSPLMLVLSSQGLLTQKEAKDINQGGVLYAIFYRFAGTC